MGSYQIWNGRYIFDNTTAVLVKLSVDGIIRRGYRVGNRLREHLDLD